MDPTQAAKAITNENTHQEDQLDRCRLPERLSQISAHVWYSHWHGERMKGQWRALVSDTALVLEAAEVLRLTPSDKFFTQYTHVVAKMHGALQIDSQDSVTAFQRFAPDIRAAVCQLRAELANGELRGDPLASRFMDRLERRFKAYVERPTDSFVQVEERAKNSAWLDAHGLSADGLSRFLDSLRPSGADAGAVFLNDPKGALIKLAEYLPPWSQDSSGEVLPSDMMSSTKSVAALLCFIAASRQLLNLDQPITEILDRTPLAPPRAWRGITARHLLNQASGLARNIRYDTGTAIDSLSLHLAVPLEYEPGTCLRYSNAGTQLIGFVLDAALRRAGYGRQSPVLEFAKEYLFDPLGFSRTSFSNLWDLPHIPLTDRGIQSTPSDFARLALVVLDPDSVVGPDGRPLLSPSDRHQLFQPASRSVFLSGPKELDEDFTQRDSYANCFYLEPYGIATRGTYNSNLDLVFQHGLKRGGDGRILIDEVTADPCLIFVRQQSDAGIGGTVGGEALQKLMTGVWQQD